MRRVVSIHALCTLFVGLGLASAALAQEKSTDEQEKSTEELAKEAQNPIAKLISVPFQSNTNFGVGPFHQPQEILNIQPVIPITINQDWNLITRWITPVISQPKTSPTDNREFGIGDLNPSLFLSPAKPGEIIWGVGPTFLLPTATDRNLGNHRWGAGPGAVVLTILPACSAKERPVRRRAGSARRPNEPPACPGCGCDAVPRCDS
ncbi:hypothetical protein SAMN05519103_09095 [Rhizobiales bacterium GAS113]|nr:hypothetical protein SAMN05519103_09095 [Rhizobiales bacterium GAS113]